MSNANKGELRLIYDGMVDGVWSGILFGAAKSKKAPALEALLEGAVLGGLKITPRANMASAWDVRLTLGAGFLQDGSSCILFRLAGAELGSFTIQAGPVAKGDQAGELALLRAELDMLKRAFRAHMRDA
ncbi:MAG: hypothetical protein ACI9AX_000273 [Polaromonas sp.]|jgi:hypothetical protein